MLVPAIRYKKEIEEEFQKILYTDKLLWYDGCVINYEHEIKENENEYKYAITSPKGELIGYISFRVDWYGSCAYNFGLMRFKDYGINYMADGIRRVISLIESYNLHRIEFRCVGGNPAASGYDKICKTMASRGYRTKMHSFEDQMRDRYGNFHDMLMFEFIKKDSF